MGFTSFTSDDGLASNVFFASHSYVEGFAPSQADVVTYAAVPAVPNGDRYPHLARWYRHIASFEDELATLPGDVSRDFTAYGPPTFTLSLNLRS